MNIIKTKQLLLTDLIKKKVPDLKCRNDKGKGMCAYYVPKEIPFEPVPRGICEHPAIKEQAGLEWIIDKNGLQFFIGEHLKNGKARRKKVQLDKRPDWISNMSECPGARWMYF